MQHELIISGFGGQGILSMGKILAYAGLLEKKEVTWFPSYGPEQRGGTSNVTVILSEKKIFSPIVNKYDIAILLNQPSLTKFESSIKVNGVLIYDKSLITKSPTRKDVKVSGIDTQNTTTQTENNNKTFNMIVLGTLIQTTKIVTFKSIIDGLKKSFPKMGNTHFLINQQAILDGMKLAKTINTHNENKLKTHMNF